MRTRKEINQSILEERRRRDEYLQKKIEQEALKADAEFQGLIDAVINSIGKPSYSENVSKLHAFNTRKALKDMREKVVDRTKFSGLMEVNTREINFNRRAV